MSTIRRAPSERGLFITFEGPDGSGKSTQARMLAERLRGEGRPVLETVEPGGTPIGQQIRRILLDPANKEITPVVELLLMFAARAQNVEQWILPALNQGQIVVSDRFTDSSIAYQGSGRGCSLYWFGGLWIKHSWGFMSPKGFPHKKLSTDFRCLGSAC